MIPTQPALLPLPRFDRAAWGALGVHVPDYRNPTQWERHLVHRAMLRDGQAALDADAAAFLADAHERRARTPVHARSSDAEIRALADRRAALLASLIEGICAPMTPAELLAWLCGQVEALQGRPFAFAGDRPRADQLRGFLARARCRFYWRRCLRRAAVELREAEARERHEVCATRRQVYVTDDTLARRIERERSNAAMMAATVLQNDEGDEYTLAQLAAASTSNKAIRRGELMTRISGCERMAEATGWRGVFFTLTAPSRFHATHRHGEPNVRHDGSTPRDAHLWLCATWAKARAALARRGVRVFGFRVAEPHHDATPHWHALLWAPAGHLWRLVRVVKRWWLADAGDEPGARRHRVKAIDMPAGAAAGYIAKYIAKNIDDAGAVGAEGHRDEGGALPDAPQGDLFGGTAGRVEAWASAHRIRQFQAIGQPPVTVWRELRRVADQVQAGAATRRMALAFEAVNRKGHRRADWGLYLAAQGGACIGRDYAIRLATEAREVFGRYETTIQDRPIGVREAGGPDVLYPSNRREWRPRGAWPEGVARAQPAPPWTRVNNCTRPVLIDGRRVDFRGLIQRAARSKWNPGEGRTTPERLDPHAHPRPDPRRRRPHPR